MPRGSGRARGSMLGELTPQLAVGRCLVASKAQCTDQADAQPLSGECWAKTTTAVVPTPGRFLPGRRWYHPGCRHRRLPGCEA
jgi:hypothetical protein